MLVGLHLVYLIGVDTLLYSGVVFEADESLLESFGWPKFKKLHVLSFSVTFNVELSRLYPERPGSFDASFVLVTIIC